MKSSFKLVLLLGILGLFGCTAPQFSEQQAYLLNARKIRPLFLPVKIAEVEIAPPFDLQNFWYRLGETRYLQDNYRGFATVPAWQIEQQLRFALNGGTNIKNEWLLHCYVTELYADYRNRHDPCAVITLKIALCYKSEKNIVKDGLYKQFDYKERVRIAENNSEALVSAWNEGLIKIIRILQQDLKKAVRQHVT